MPGVITPGRAYKHLQRYRQVIAVLTKYGFGEFFGQIRAWERAHIERGILHHEQKINNLTTAERIRMALEELGPTFVKMGQMLSTRPDILPQNYILELEKLQNQVSPVPALEARQIIESELKRPVSEIFSSFDDQPLAAASLAQVHRATIKGEEVVVKIQRPNIVQIIEVDLDIMRNLAVLMERYLPATHVLNPVGLVKEFSINIKKELDFRQEAANMRRFAKNFSDSSWIHIPRVYPENCCTQRILIMEYIDGINISQVDKLKDQGYDLKLIARRGADIAFRSALEFGFFHADPHPGNLFILPHNVVCLLDYGLMGTLSSRDREKLGKLLYFMQNGDEKRTSRALRTLMESAEQLNAEELEHEVSRIIQEYGHLTFSEIQLGQLLFRFLNLLREHDARFPTHLIWLFKSVATLEETCYRLDADFEMLGFIKPYARKLILRDLNPLHQARELYFSALDSASVLKDLPYDFSVVLDQLKKGRVKIEFEHIGLEPLRKTLERVSHHLSLALLLSSVLLASALIVSARIPPMVGEVSVLGLAGFILAALLAVVLIISVIIEK